MAKFKIGDKVEWVGESPCGIYCGADGASYMVITKHYTEPGEGYYYDIYDNEGDLLDSCFGCDSGDFYNRLRLVNGKGVKKVARRTFKQLKDTPDVKKGALWQEDCEDGTQPYSLITPDSSKSEYEMGSYRTRSLVEDQPQWFVEVFKVTPEYMTKEELEKFEAFKKTQSKRSVGRPKKGKK